VDGTLVRQPGPEVDDRLGHVDPGSRHRDHSAVGIVLVVRCWRGASRSGNRHSVSTLLAAIGDVVHPRTRATSVGVYRLWRDAGYAAGALVSGVTADLLGVGPSIGLVAAITMLSGVVVAVRMRETLSLRRLADSR
jgi:predicted MFS family arabinose efflux permease